GSDAGLALALTGEPPEDSGRFGKVAPEIANPPRSPTGFLGRAGRGVAFGERGVGGIGGVEVADLLLDAPHGVQRFRRLAAVGEAPGEVPEELERGGVVVGVPAPVRG